MQLTYRTARKAFYIITSMIIIWFSVLKKKLIIFAIIIWIQRRKALRYTTNTDHSSNSQNLEESSYLVMTCNVSNVMVLHSFSALDLESMSPMVELALRLAEEHKVKTKKKFNYLLYDGSTDQYEVTHVTNFGTHQPTQYEHQEENDDILSDLMNL